MVAYPGTPRDTLQVGNIAVHPQQQPQPRSRPSADDAQHACPARSHTGSCRFPEAVCSCTVRSPPGFETNGIGQCTQRLVLQESALRFYWQKGRHRMTPKSRNNPTPTDITRRTRRSRPATIVGAARSVPTTMPLYSHAHDRQTCGCRTAVLRSQPSGLPVSSYCNISRIHTHNYYRKRPTFTTMKNAAMNHPRRFGPASKNYVLARESQAYAD
jgi:hypothetical protein